MRASRALIVGASCAAIVAAGYVAAPKELPTLTFVVPAGEATPAPDASAPSTGEAP